ncbi:hypothetical protein MADA3029_1070174 [Vibrio nigripulchritudo MADA3029]|nr:hypothetical protein VIBNIMADA3021_840174 [Vibrio nigripulchritudo MADA3021]CCN57124.1 hypothetical protein MADA3029_1070174 [Vibrio nigripulchritudo MADA3029]
MVGFSESEASSYLEFRLLTKSFNIQSFNFVPCPLGTAQEL